MSWRDNLLTGDFRGAAFRTSSHTLTFGRRNSVHQYPYVDGTTVEDLGLDADEFTLEVYVIANYTADQTFGNNGDYFGQRNELIKALKKKGPGTLVHPYLGKTRVNVNGRVRVSESFSEGGICKFTIPFVVAGKIDYPETATDPKGDVDRAAKDTKEEAQDSAADGIDTNVPSWSLQQLYNDFKKFTNIGNSYISRVRNSGGNQLRDFKASIDNARSLAATAVQVPCQFAGLVVDVYDSVLNMVNVLGPGYAVDVLSDCVGRVIDRVNSSTGEFIDNIVGVSMIQSLTSIAGSSASSGFGSESNEAGNTSLQPISITTLDSAKTSANRDHLVNLAKTGAITTATQIAVRTDFTSIEEANTQTEKIIESLNYLLTKLGDESASDPYSDYGIYTDNRGLYSQLVELKSVFIRSMKEITLGLARNTAFEVADPDGRPAIDISYNLYSSIDRMDEIFIRNRSAENDHPGFMSGELNILSE